ncbi:MAG: M20 family metallopeptidase [Paracoccaceae bacterium]|jgi:acetylornithine deacetylase/succinyl-diaminopimelate desuccinylase-like protein|nr:M20 family metallopeptidase [Paracoccaceae bacterium]
MTRQTAITAATTTFDNGAFLTEYADWIAHPTESQPKARPGALHAYLNDAITPRLARMGFTTRIVENTVGEGPFLIAERHEGDDLPTVLTYGHGDTVPGMEGQWREDRDPWTLTEDGDRLYGRGTADNKGQHLVNLTAMEAVLNARGHLGFNARVIIEMGEEAGSAGLHELFLAEKDALSADVLIASDGPRQDPKRPMIFMGARGAVNFELTVDLREGGHHSGNWGGLLADPGVILSHAIASITDASGAIRILEWRPNSLTPAVKAALADMNLTAPDGGPSIDPDWGEPGLSAAEKVVGWNSFAVLTMLSGDPAKPVNAVQPMARAVCQLRFVVGTEMDDIVPALRRHLAREGFDKVVVTSDDSPMFTATRLDPDHPWAVWTAQSIERTMGAPAMVVPNLGGSLPNEEFAVTLGMPTIWIPHSYTGCSQHAPNEHALKPILREGLAVMAGVWWDLGAGDTPKL